MSEPAGYRPDGPPPTSPITNLASNYGAQGVFHAPVYIALSRAVGRDTALHVLAALRGVGRALIVLGILLYLAGFGIFGYFVLSFLIPIFSTVQSPDPSQPPDLSGLRVVPLLPLGAGLLFLGTVVTICGMLFLAWRVTSSAAAELARGEDQPAHGPRAPEARPVAPGYRGPAQPHRARRALPGGCALALLLPLLLLALGAALLGLLRSGVLDGRGGASPAATSPPSSTARVYAVANTGGEGLYLRRSPQRTACKTAPRPANCVVPAYREGTALRQIGPDQVHAGQTWRQVRAPDGQEGWVLAEYTIERR